MGRERERERERASNKADTVPFRLSCIEQHVFGSFGREARLVHPLFFSCRLRWEEIDATRVDAALGRSRQKKRRKKKKEPPTLEGRGDYGNLVLPAVLRNDLWEKWRKACHVLGRKLWAQEVPNPWVAHPKEDCKVFPAELIFFFSVTDTSGSLKWVAVRKG